MRLGQGQAQAERRGGLCVASTCLLSPSEDFTWQWWGGVMPLHTSESSQGPRPYCIHPQSAKFEEAGEKKSLEQGSLTWFPTADQEDPGILLLLPCLEVIYSVGLRAGHRPPWNMNQVVVA